MSIGIRRSLSIALGCAALLIGCGHQSQPAPTGSIAQGKAQAANSGVAPNAAPSTVEVIFVTGDVQGRRQGTWSAIDTGASFSRGDAVRTGVGAECQLRLADMAVVSIQESTQVELDSLQFGSSGSRVTLGLVGGTVLSKVRKLGNSDGYTVRTSSAIAGVRGTAFAVTMNATGSATIAVQEGVVAVLPAAFDTEALQSQAGSPVSELNTVIDRVNAQAATVAAGREMTVTAAANAAATARFAPVRDAAAQIAREQAAGQAPSSAAVTVRAAAVDAAVRGLAAATGTPAPLSAASQRQLQPLGRMPEPGQAPPQSPSSGVRTPPPPAAQPAAPSQVHLSVTVVPGDAEILNNGVIVGTGRYSADLPAGATQTLLVRREGYASRTIDVQATAGKPATYNVQLDPQPLEARFTVSASPLIGAVEISGSSLVSADGTGHVIAIDRQGRVLWTAATLNTPNENSFAVAGSGVVAFSGAQELLLLDAASGQPVSRTPLDSTSTHLFGQRVWLSATLGISPTASGLRTFDPRTGRTLRDYPIPGGTLMSPSVANGKIYAVSQTGLFVVVDEATGSLVTQIPTQASQPVASSVLVVGSRAYFADRKGLLVAVDPDAQRVAWQKTLPGQGGGGVFQDLAGSADGVFLFTRNTVYAYSPDGTPLFNPIAGASTPPLLLDGRLYFGTQDGRLLAVDARTGRTIASLAVGAALTTRPVQDGPRIVVGSTKGEVLVIYPGTMQ